MLPAWQPFAPSGRFDAVHWSTPPKIATLMGPERTGYILPREEAPAAAGPEVPATAAAGEPGQPPEQPKEKESAEQQPKPAAAAEPAAAS